MKSLFKIQGQPTVQPIHDSISLGHILVHILKQTWRINVFELQNVPWKVLLFLYNELREKTIIFTFNA